MSVESTSIVQAAEAGSTLNEVLLRSTAFLQAENFVGTAGEIVNSILNDAESGALTEDVIAHWRKWVDKDETKEFKQMFADLAAKEQATARALREEKWHAMTGMWWHEREDTYSGIYDVAHTNIGDYRIMLTIGDGGHPYHILRFYPIDGLGGRNPPSVLLWKERGGSIECQEEGMREAQKHLAARKGYTAPREWGQRHA